VTTLPQPIPLWRFPRARLEGTNPAALRLTNGQTIAARLRVVSVTGGLLALPKPVAEGSQVRLIFLTQPGTVLAGAEMLQPVGDGLQPFRFVSLAADDQLRLGAFITRSTENKSEQEWMEKLRAARSQQFKPRRCRFAVEEVVGALMMSFVMSAFLLQPGLLK